MLAISGGQVRVYVDGFNLYHGVKPIPAHKWLDLQALCDLFVPSSIARRSVLYYTAYANHNSASKVARHRLYVQALEETGVSVTVGRFKRKQLLCRATCRQEFVSHEEKETDVNLAVAIVEDALLGLYDPSCSYPGIPTFSQPSEQPSDTARGSTPCSPRAGRTTTWRGSVMAMPG